MAKALTDPKIPTGIYNIASESVHLPSYIKERYNWGGGGCGILLVGLLSGSGV